MTTGRGARSASTPGPLLALLHRTFRVALSALAALAATLAVLFLLAWQSERWVLHTREIARLARTSFSLVTERETAIRGYLLTGNPVLLGPETAAREPLRHRLDSLVALTRDPGQRVRARRIERAVTRWDREFASRVLAVPLDSIPLPVARGDLADKPLFDPVRASFAEFLHVEDRLYRESVRRFRMLAGAAVVITLVEIGVVALMLRRFRDQLLAQAAAGLEQQARLTEQAARLEGQAVELEGSNRALRQAVHELEAFSYSVAHDLRTPLRGLDGYSHALLEDYGERLDPPARGYLERIRGNAQRMGELIDGILSLSRIGRGELRRERLDVSTMARRIAEDLRSAEPSRAVELRIPDGLTAEGDPRLVGDLLQNLLGNAWKFTAGRTPAVIELGTSTRDGQQVYFVRDNGVGFDPAFGDRLFRPFERLHGAAFEGHGLGLAIVQRVVQRHGGRVWAEGALDAGMTVYFTLPDGRT